jgi:hypothetical protein
MENSSADLSTMCRNLAEYAVDRDDIKVLVHNLPKDQNINTVTLDYELQLLKIISVGWALSVCMENHPDKTAAAVEFWNLINGFSKDISQVTNMMIGHDVDYFQLIKDRFDYYLKSMDKKVTGDDPASAIGPAFAECCKDKDNPFVVITGARIFSYSVRGVKEYLESLGIQTN